MAKSGVLPRQPAYVRPYQLALLALWFGLLTGFGEVAIVAIKTPTMHQFRSLGNLVWMTPLTNVVVFVIPGIFISLAARCRPGLISPRAAAFMLSFLGFLGLLLLFPQLHRYAKLLLASGLAVQTANFIAARPWSSYAAVRRTSSWLLAFVVGVAVSMHGWQVLAEQRALTKLPPAAPNAPNVLLIVLDTVRAKSLSLYEYDRPTTPQLERLSERGVRFEWAISPSSWTLPAHASMFTGRLPHELSASWQTPLDGTYPTLAEVLSSHGYVTAGFVGNTAYCSSEFGLNRGFAHYEDNRLWPGWLVLSSSLAQALAERHGPLRRIIGNYEILGRKNAARVSRDFLRWLSRQESRPFFAFLNYYDAHEPYLPPKDFAMKFAPKKPRGHFVSGQKLSAREIGELRDAYDGAIAYLDYELGLLFSELEKRHVLENTLVIITSDHGEQFGEHGLISHGNSLYLPGLHVPLLIIFPSRVPPGKIVHQPVGLHDLPATVLDLVGLTDEKKFPGASLARHWGRTGNGMSPEDHPVYSEVDSFRGALDWTPISKGDMKSLIFGNYHYIENGDGQEELYEFKKDPLEKDNLADPHDGLRMLTGFRKSLESILVQADRH